MLTLTLALPHPAKAQQSYVELLHLWAVGEEAYALEAFAEPVRAAGVDWQEHVTTTNFTGIKSILTERLSLGVPPTAVQWIGGREDVVALYESGVFRLISREIAGETLSETMRPEISEIVAYQDGFLLLPTGIHIMNHTVYNAKILEEIGVAVPETWDEFISAARLAEAHGYHGLAISDERWQLRNLMFGILVALLDVDSFRAIATGDNEDSYDLASIVTAFERLREVQDVSIPNSRDLPWAQTVATVVGDKAMASIIGDFSSPLYPESGHFICALPPGNRYILWAFDTFGLTSVDDPSAIEGQKALVEAVSNLDNQLNYIIRKGGVSAFEGLDVEKLNRCSRKSTQIWEGDAERIFLTSSSWAKNLNVLANVAQSFWRETSMTAEEAASQMAVTLRTLSDNEKSQ